MSDTTTIEISRQNWRRLNARKYPGESFNDVLGRLLSGTEAEGTEEPAGAIEPEPVQEAAHVDVDDLDLPGQGEIQERRRDAVRAAYEHLRAGGRAPRSELEEIAAEIAGDTYSDSNSLWKNCVQSALRELPDVESEGPSGYWRYSPA